MRKLTLVAEEIGEGTQVYLEKGESRYASRGANPERFRHIPTLLTVSGLDRLGAGARIELEEEVVYAAASRSEAVVVAGRKENESRIREYVSRTTGIDWYITVDEKILSPEKTPVAIAVNGAYHTIMDALTRYG